MLGRRRACRVVQAVQAVRGVGRSCGGGRGRGSGWVVVGGEGGGVVVVGGGGAGGGGYELGGGGSSFFCAFDFVLGLIGGCQLGDDDGEVWWGGKKIKIT